MDIFSELPTWAKTAIVVAAVLAGTAVLNRVIVHVIAAATRRVRGGDRISLTHRKRIETLSAVLGAVATTLLWGIGLLIALDRAGVNLAPLLATAGIGGVALGFGAQNVVRDFLAGTFILVEEQFDVGDVIEAAGVSGYVERITLRTTRLRDIDGRVHVVPNGEIRVSTNHTKGYSRFLLDLPVPYEDDPDKVADAVRAIVDDMRDEPEYAARMIGDLKVLGVEDYGASDVKLRMYIDAVPGEQWVIGRELRRRMAKAYGSDLTVPYPRRVVYSDARSGR